MSLLVANWKMNKTVSEAVDFMSEFLPLLKTNNQVVICPPATALSELSKEVENTDINLGAQNLFYETSGAFTGELSPLMVVEHCSYVIIGHSERRQHFNETNEIVNKKVKAAIKEDLNVILCVGESLEQREANQTIDHIKQQVTEGLAGIEPADMEDVIIAYEPIWAIGTGKNATPEQAEEVHDAIRNMIKDLYNQEIAQKTIILYGGSVKPANSKELLSQKNINGALVGGASLNPEDFADICNN